MHNREIRIVLVAMCAIGVLFVLLELLFFGAGAALLCGVTASALVLVFLYFTAWRYRQILALSQYLTKVYTGKQPVDIRDQKPGELSVLKDDIYKTTMILQEQRTQLENDKAFLKDTLNNITHQLKTPLSAIFLQAEVWAEPATPAVTKCQCAQEILVQTERMQWLIEKLLKLSRLDAKAVIFEIQPWQAMQVIQRAASGFLLSLEQKKIDFRIMCAEDLQCRCDLPWTAEALANLIKNGIEHTPQGGCITICCLDNPIYFEMSVSNTGASIPEQELPHLFERFWKGKGASPSSAGIGLALAKAIVQAQDGELTVQNAEDSVKFTVRLYKREK